MRNVFYLNGRSEKHSPYRIGLFVMIADYNHYINRSVAINDLRDIKKSYPWVVTG